MIKVLWLFFAFGFLAEGCKTGPCHIKLDGRDPIFQNKMNDRVAGANRHEDVLLVVGGGTKVNLTS